MTRIAVLGTGMVGRALAGRFAELGHEVCVGTRDVAATLARTEPDAMGGPPYAQWATANPQIPLQPLPVAAAGAELVVNATSGAASIGALREAGVQNLTGKVLLDVANPLDFSAGMPPTLFVKDTDSLAEQIQREFPQASVVKALNVVTADLMVDPQRLAGGDFSLFVCSDDPVAKQTVIELLEAMGHRDVIDLGGLRAARGTEMVLPIWLQLMSALGTPMFAFKVVR